jgi:hypothetical protein
MSYEHIMKTQAQWEKTSAKYMLIPEGVLCIEVIDQDNMNLKIGDGNRTFAQLPYVNSLESVITELGQVVHTNTKGQPDGVASLNASGVVPEAQIDRETIHGYYNGTNFYTDSAYTELITPRSDRFYIDHVSNRNYRYENGYIKLSSDGGGGQTYQPGTGLDLDEDTFNHSNAISPGTAKGSDTKTLEYGGTFEIPSITYDVHKAMLQEKEQPR